MRRQLIVLGLLTLAGFGFADMRGLVAPVREQVAPKWRSIPLDEVRLTEGSYFYQMMRHQRDYVLSLEVDRLVGHVLESQGLPRKGANYGGWEPGCTYAHYLSALSLFYASTGEQVFLDRLDYLLGELKRASDVAPERWFLGRRNGEGRNTMLLAFDALMRGDVKLGRGDETGQPWTFNGIGNSWYGIHKTLAGLRDAYLYAKRPLAREIARPLVDRIATVMLRTNRDIAQAMLAVEHGGMVEVMCDFAQIFNEPRYLAAAERFHHITVMYPTALGEDVLTGRHANDQIPKFVGLAREYALTGRPVCLDAAVNFWDLVVRHHTLAHGGNSCYERFGRADDEIHRLDATCGETCNTYNMLKLSRRLFELRGDMKYLDYSEIALYNHILGSIDPCHRGAMTYYTALRTGDYKMYSTPENSFWCCVGTGLENPAKYCANMYYTNGRDLVIGLFVPSMLNWREQNAQIVVETNYPEADDVRIHIVRKGAFTGRILVRRPAWMGKGEPFTFSNVREGGVLTVKLPRRLWLRPAKGEPQMGSLFCGPVLLAADLGAKDVHDVDQGERREPAWEQFPELVGPLKNLNAWLTEKEPLVYELKTPTQDRPLVFKPYAKLHHRRLGPYWKFYSPASYKLRQAAFTDCVWAGDDRSETAHALAVSAHSVADFHADFWEKRHRQRFVKDGEFSYTLRIDPQETRPYQLIATYWGGERSSSQFEILVDGRPLAAVKLGHRLPLSYLDETYAIPVDWTRGRKSIRVMFRATGGHTAGPLFKLRITSDLRFR